VLAVGSAGKVERRRVETHGMTRTDWVVTGELTDGDQVIVSGLQKVHPGGVARAVPAEGAGGADQAPAQP
jgi:membrane fusion protein (multidrug efflux system)